MGANDANLTACSRRRGDGRGSSRLRLGEESVGPGGPPARADARAARQTAREVEGFVSIGQPRYAEDEPLPRGSGAGTATNVRPTSTRSALPAYAAPPPTSASPRGWSSHVRSQTHNTPEIRPRYVTRRGRSHLATASSPTRSLPSSRTAGTRSSSVSDRAELRACGDDRLSRISRTGTSWCSAPAYPLPWDRRAVSG